MIGQRRRRSEAHSDADRRFAAMLDTLIAGKSLVFDELERIEAGPWRDRASVCRLCEAVHSLAEQADALLLLMVARGSDRELVECTERLFDAFRDLEARTLALESSLE